jgi:hypothetical protein
MTLQPSWDTHWKKISAKALRKMMGQTYSNLLFLKLRATQALMPHTTARVV